ncbi:MAG: 4-hydroxy-tetrahydrodipicolinate reductase [Clostridia bacterium]|nr:4-hydroxy-tetrahydrodipicolinate reductase [Clostridia bacterium]
MIKIAVCGACGKMGQNILELLETDAEAQTFCGIDPNGGNCKDIKVYKSFNEIEGKPDVIIDFSSPAALESELEYAVKNNVPAVIGSTGFTPEQLKAIEAASKKVAVFRTANFSLGVNLLCELVKRAAQTLGEKFDIEIIERHHNKKVDAPSGTAIMLAESANSAFDGEKQYLNGREGICGKRGNEIGIHAVRGGTIVGEHEVAFCGEDEIITLSHSARSKKVFAAGAIRAAKWLAGKPAGLYNMGDLLAD